MATYYKLVLNGGVELKVMTTRENKDYYNYPPTNLHETEPYYHAFEIAYQVTSTFVMFGAASVILTALLFPSMVKEKVYMHVLVMISVCDFFTAFSSSFGFPAWNDPVCTAQAVIALFFIRAGWLWTLLILLQLDSLLQKGTLMLSVRNMHLIVWTATALLEITPPILGVKYGTSVYWSESGLCTYAFEPTPQYKVVVITGFLGFLVVMVAVMIGFFLRIFFGMRKRMCAESNRSIVYTVALYPLTVLMSWLPLVIFISTIINLAPDSTVNVRSYTTFTALLLWSFVGSLAFTGVFFYNSAEARIRWSRLLTGIGKGKWDIGPVDEEQDDDDRVDLSVSAVIAEDFAVDTVLLQNVADAEEEFRITSTSRGSLSTTASIGLSELRGSHSKATISRLSSLTESF